MRVRGYWGAAGDNLHEPEALDHLTDIFLAAGILKPISQVAEKSCQEGETEENVVSV